MKIKIYTDGSCRGNGKETGGQGAWGFIAVDETDAIIYKTAEGVKNTTNQQMELMAAARACQWSQEQFGPFTDIQIISDSAYLINCVNQHWHDKWETNNWIASNKQPVKNRGLWEQLIPFFRLANYSFTKVKGHANDFWNNQIDEMVQSTTMAMIK